MLLGNKEIVDDHTLPGEALYGRYDVLLLDAESRQALAAMRSLGKRGMSVAALATHETSSVPAFSSRWCQQKFISKASENTPEYLAYLLQVLKTARPRLLIPASDGTIELIRHHRAELEQYTRIALASEPALTMAVNKGHTLQVARKLGLAIPKGISITNSNEVTIALREVGLPAVVKPARSWDSEQGFRQASHLVTTPGEARYAVNLLTRGGSSVLFQQFLPGERESIGILFAQGEVFAKFAYRIMRTNPPLGGTDVVRESIVPPADISEQAEHLVREIDLEGYSLVEFRRDKDGIPHLMEINSRLTAGIELAIRAGVDFPYLLYQWAIGMRPDCIHHYRTGYRMRDLGSDIAATLAALSQHGRPGIPTLTRTILNFCASFFLPARYDYLDGSDLRPIGAAIAGWCKDLPEHIEESRARRNALKMALEES